MFLLELFATMRARRRSTQRHHEEGAEITRRLRELLDSTMPKQVETPPTIAASGRLPENPETIQEERAIAARFRRNVP
jgi:hypothetical protein